jgi:SAM-dependent methyltransferase
VTSQAAYNPNRVKRTQEPEILDGDGLHAEMVKRAYRDIARIHRWLGDTRFMTRAIRQNHECVRCILDVGCGTGVVLEHVRRKLQVEALGVELNVRESITTHNPIVQADAVRDALPNADVAFSMHLAHHLSEAELVDLIRNVGRSCRRFILLDLVRHPLPLALFRVFVAPFVCRIVALDGQQSIRRAYTPTELHRIAAAALIDSGGTFKQYIAPLYTRQVVDILYR